MINSIYGGNSYNSAYGLSSLNPSMFDYKAQQSKMKDLLAGDKTKAEVKTLKKETAAFLDTYAANTTDLKKSAQAVTGNNLQKLLYGVGGSSDQTPTAENVKKTTDAVQKLVDSFNNNLTMLNKNAERGPGVVNQIARMVTGPAAEKSMAQVGVTVNKDGTLALDKEKLATALTGTKETRSLALDIIGGSSASSMASGVSRIAMSADSKTPQALISNDLANIKGLQDRYQETLMSALGASGTFSQMGMYSRSGAYNMMNMGTIGMLMNVIA